MDRKRVSDPAGASTDPVAIDGRSALLFPQAAPLTPAPGLRDARAVWCNAPARPDGTVLIYLHGHNNYVTVDATGKSRLPDWATDDAAQRGAWSKSAAPLAYELDKLENKRTGRSPLVLAPEDAVHATGSFWAREPAGQYADPAALGRLVDGCKQELATLGRAPGGGAYLQAANAPLRRVCLSGHSGAGLPLEEAARSALILPEVGAPADLWLFDCTYWSNVAGFVAFCARWHAAGRLPAGDARSARFICIYRQGTDTEGVADDLRRQVALTLGVSADSLVQDHVGADDAATRRQVAGRAVLFLRTKMPHDTIPTFFIPVLLGTAG